MSFRKECPDPLRYCVIVFFWEEWKTLGISPNPGTPLDSRGTADEAKGGSQVGKDSSHVVIDCPFCPALLQLTLPLPSCQLLWQHSSSLYGSSFSMKPSCSFSLVLFQRKQTLAAMSSVSLKVSILTIP